MKKTLLLAVSAIFILNACGTQKEESVEDLIAKGDLTALKEKKKTVNQEYLRLSADLKALDAALEKIDPRNNASLVSVYEVKDTVFNYYVELQGNVETKQNIVIYPEYSGMLKKVYVQEGQKVKKGQLLALIDDGGLGQQLDQAKVENDLAKTTFERQKRLWDQKIGSEIQYLQAKTSYEASVKAIAQLNRQLDRTRVTAPFDGVVDNIIVEEGTIVTPSPEAQLMRIVNLSNMYVQAEVPERYLPSIKKGTEVIVEFPVIGKTVKGKVRQVSNYINPFNRTFRIEVAVPNKDKSIKPNLTAKLGINNYTNPSSVLLPLSIISENAQGQQFVYVVDESKGKEDPRASKRIVQTGLSQGDFVEILDGIEQGDLVIKDGARRVKDSAKVRYYQ